MQLEFHQLERRWEHLRVRHAARQRRLLASLAESEQEAAEAFRGAAQARPGYARAHNSLGAALFRMSRTAEAAEEFLGPVPLLLSVIPWQEVPQ